MEWWFAEVKETGPHLYGVFLGLDLESSAPQVTRYLTGKFEDQLLPFGVDRFDTLAEARQRCADDFGLKDEDWEELKQPPEFHAAVEESTDAAIGEIVKTMFNG